LRENGAHYNEEEEDDSNNDAVHERMVQHVDQHLPKTPDCDFSNFPQK